MKYATHKDLKQALVCGDGTEGCDVCSRCLSVLSGMEVDCRRHCSCLFLIRVCWDDECECIAEMSLE